MGSSLWGIGKFHRMSPKTKKYLKVLAILVTVLAEGLLLLQGCAFFGGNVSGDRLDRVMASTHQENGTFRNTVPQRAAASGNYWNYIVEQFSGDQVRVPPAAIPVTTVDPEILTSTPAAGLRAIWLGHATVYLELDGKRVLIDPILSDYAAPIDWFGPKRFHPSPIALEDLPRIDAVLISHDHYDHLDMKTVQHLAKTGSRFFVPLGIGAHLDAWDVPADQIVELDWWQNARLPGLEIVSTPARHYSGRELFDYKETLWSSWTVIGADHRIFYSGDTGYSDHFKNIGEKYGPFDLAVIKIGAYGPGNSWIDIHMDPEHAVQSFVDVRGKRMLPVHWATFNMAFHDWQEPVIRAVRAAKELNIDLVTPRVGEIVTSGVPFHSENWWADIN